MKNYITFGFVLLTIIFSCKSQKEKVVVEEKETVEKDTEKKIVKLSMDEMSGAYILTSIEGIEEMEGIIPTLVIGNDGKINGMNGCNSFFGSINEDPGEVLFQEIGSTRKMCNGIANEIENSLMSFLNEVNKVENNVEGGLNFMIDDRVVVKTKKATLEGQWKLIAFKGKDESKRDIQFNIIESQLEGNGGCNVFNGQLEQTNFEAKFTEMRSTEMACEGVDMAFETNFINSFDKVTSFKVGKEFTTFYYNQEVIFTAKKEL